MYAVYVDDKLLYSTAPGYDNYIILNPKISLEVNKPGLFSFTLPPGHVLYDGIQKLKSTLTVEQDGEEIYRGRVISDETDIFGQKNVECESEIAFFHDSIQRPYEYDGTPFGLFELLIDNHNAMVNEDQQFTIGTVTAVSSSGTAQVETDEYGDTFSELNTRMVNAYGGYLRVRHAGGVRYIDYLADGDENTQPIEFGVNLLDLQKNISAEEVFNVLIPHGAMQKGENNRYTTPLSIADVNGGLDYIEDAAAVARYGKRIWKTKTWNYIEDAETLLEKGREYLATGISEETTLVINAVDMHFVDAGKQRIGIGDRVRIISNPLGIDRTETCTKIEMDMLNPENTQYTFGKPPMTLTDNIVHVNKTGGGGGGGGNTVKEELSNIRRTARIYKSEADGYIDLIVTELDVLTNNYKEVGIVLDAVEADLNLYAEKFTAADEALTRIEVDLNAIDEELTLKVDKSGVISAINMTSEEITIQASKINLSGYVTTSALNASIADLEYAQTTAITTNSINATNTNFTYLKATAFTFNGTTMSKRNMTVTTPDGDKTIYYMGYVV